VYQTGVWVPLIVAGPMVASPDREVKSMINITDLFQLFGEIAGADVRKIVPASHILDSQPMLAYLTNPKQPSIRETNFTQTANNIHIMPPPPCVITLTMPATCVQLFNSKQLCNFEGGNWFGPDPDGGTSYQSCCDVKRNDPMFADALLLPINQEAARNDDYKLVRKSLQKCGSSSDQDMAYTVNEFYKIDESVPIPAIDKADLALCDDVNTMCPNGLSTAEKKTYAQLTASMDQTLGSEPPCPGDGNEDKVVNLDDVTNWFYFATNGVPSTTPNTPPNTSSWYDFNHDGNTDKMDLQLIVKYFGTKCAKKN
jgi:hypothetical protein